MPENCFLLQRVNGRMVEADLASACLFRSPAQVYVSQDPNFSDLDPGKFPPDCTIIVPKWLFASLAEEQQNAEEELLRQKRKHEVEILMQKYLDAGYDLRVLSEEELAKAPSLRQQLRRRCAEVRKVTTPLGIELLVLYYFLHQGNESAPPGLKLSDFLALGSPSTVDWADGMLYQLFIESSKQRSNAEWSAFVNQFAVEWPVAI